MCVCVFFHIDIILLLDIKITYYASLQAMIRKYFNEEKGNDFLVFLLTS